MPNRPELNPVSRRNARVRGGSDARRAAKVTLFQVVWTEQSKRSLEKLERDVAVRVIRKVEACKSDPYRFLKKLVGERAWRLRVGDWRVLVDLEGENERIVVLEVGHRKNIYK